MSNRATTHRIRMPGCRRLSRISSFVLFLAGAVIAVSLIAAEKRAESATAREAADAAIHESLQAWFEDHPTGRIYIQLNKPMVQPGETLWFRATLFDTATLAPFKGAVGYTCKLVDPRGATVVEQRVQLREGAGEGQVQIPDGVAGGEYKLKVECISGPSEERPIVVNAYEPPMIKKKLTVLGKAYGPGDRVEAKAEFYRGTGEALAGKAVTGIVQVDGREFKRLELMTDDAGKLLVSVDLPDAIETENALLTLMVSEGGITESISRSIPILLSKLNLDLFPEGGDLVVGLPSRVYFQALKPSGKPAEVTGVVIDEAGAEIARVESYYHGMGRFEITPEAGRRYEVKVLRPVGVTRAYRLPAARPDGVVMRVADDFTGQRSDCRVTLHATQAVPDVTVVASLRETIRTVRTLDLVPGANEIALYPESGQGVMRITVLDAEFAPLCERLVYRNQGHDLRVEIEADKDHYMPREKVTLNIRSMLPNGKPVPADLCLSVVDDRVLMYADDKTAHILTHLYLEKDLPGTIEEPNRYFDPDEEKAELALELLMGTRGWRRFEWQRVRESEKHRDLRVADQIIAQAIEKYYGDVDDDFDGEAEGAVRRDGARNRLGRLAERAKKLGAGMFRRPRPKTAAAAPRGAMMEAEMAVDAVMAMPVPVDAPEDAPVPVREIQVAKEPQLALADADALVIVPGLELKEEAAGEAGRWGKAKRRAGFGAWGWAVVRQFPVVRYETTKTDVRSDFRETIYWQPRVATDENGRATVEFWLSDAVTSFKVLAEGSGTAGVPGRGELVIDSRTPMHIEAKMPVALSAGDIVELPLRITNETDSALSVAGGISLPAGLKALFGEDPFGTLTVGAGDATTVYLAMQAQPGRSSGGLSFWAGAEGLTDKVSRTVRVEPVGFPMQQSVSDTVSDRRSAVVKLPAGVVEGSLDASIKFYPSPMATILEGLESILREPCGCFEQTSSSTYPNVMVLNYLRGTDNAEPAVEKRALALIKKGYQRLVGYECKKKGYEWFGGDPGHEALTAYGIMEFIDMAKVYDGVDQEMIQRTVRWILARRDGKGGFERNARALDTFGRAEPAVTDAYVVWALSEAGIREIGTEVDAVVKNAYQAKNPYLIGLALLALCNHDPAGGDTKELAGMLTTAKQKDGSWAGEGRSITGSTGRQMNIEATSLAIAALLRAGTPAAALNDSVQWLISQRSGGGFGCTQSTIMALKALVEYAGASRVTQADGDIVVRVNGNVVARRHFNKGDQGVIEVAEFAELLEEGDNDIDVQLMSEKELPFSLDVTYKTTTPASSGACPVRLTTRLGKGSVPMGETVALDIELANTAAEGQPMTLVRVGIPAGLTPQMWQLKELREKGVFDFYETTPREVIIYYRSLAPNAKKRVRLDLRADIPGKYTGIASCAYPYYSPQHKWWNTPLGATVAR